MANYLDTLLGRIDDPDLAAALTREVERLRDQRQFGLVFERHLPERVRLYSHPIRRGVTVQVKAETDGPVWMVQKVSKSQAHIARLEGDDQLEEQHPVSDLVVVREFGQPIYPGLKSVGKVERGGDKPFHTVINAENFHALETLLYAYEGAVDAVLIDPPYNTGADSWSYSDKFVDSNDNYRHSKWLAFMERRLQLARQLLKPSGLLLIHIDDSEQARLKLLCDQIMGSSNFIATTVWKSKSGGANDAGLAVDHEYVLIYRATAQALVRPDKLAVATTSYNNEDEFGRYALERLDKQNLGYQASLDFPITGPDGKVYRVHHRDSKNKQARWRWSKETVAERYEELVFRDGCVYTKNYEKDEYIARSLMTDERFGRTRTGSTNLKQALGVAKAFDYPKPVKLLEHLLRIAAGPDAVVLDFFGGSGTTSVAAMSLNAQDGGRRTSILVTNNELSKKQAASLRRRGFSVGDEEWEKEGVFRKVCMPRLFAEVTGVRPDGTTFSGGFEENVEFFELTYQDRDHVSLGHAFAAIAPLLWLKAGAQGPRIARLPEGEPWALPADGTYGILFEPNAWRKFVKAVDKHGGVRHVFVVTDAVTAFQQVLSELPAGVEATMLYEDYLSTFEINTGLGAE